MADRSLGRNPGRFWQKIVNIMQSEEDKEIIRNLLLEAGACAVGFAEAGEIEQQAAKTFYEWIGNGYNSGMTYLERHMNLRLHTDNVLPGCKTVISLAFSYNSSKKRDENLSKISSYALMADYHDVIRKRLSPVINGLKKEYGGKWRLCIDSAPLAERFWAVKSGIGILGKNGAIIINSYGSKVFLAEILTTLYFCPDIPIEEKCIGCDKCIKVCPTGALQNDGIINTNKCLSYLTIEKRGNWDSAESVIMSSAGGDKTLFGCECCITVCPYNQYILTSTIPEFIPDDKLLKISEQEILRMTEKEFNEIFKRTPLKRAKYEGLRRNAMNIVKRDYYKLKNKM